MYDYFTAKIFDSLRQLDQYDRNSVWNNEGNFALVTNKPENKGVTIDTTGGSGTLRIFKNILEVFEIGDVLTMRCKHDKPIEKLGVETDFELVSNVLYTNVDKGSYFESACNIVLTSQANVFYIFVYPILNSGELKVFDIEQLSEKNNNLAVPIYLSTRQDITMEGKIALPYLSIPDTRNRSIKPSEVSVSASDVEIDIYNKGTEVSEILYERMNTDDTLFWNEKVEIYGHYPGVTERIYFGHIESITNDPLETIYTLQTMDVFKLLKTDIFSRELGVYEDAGITESITDVNNIRLPIGFTAVEEVYEGETIRHLLWYGNAINCVEAIMQVIFSKPENRVGVDFLTGDYLDYIDIESFQEVKSAIGVNGDDYTFTFYNSIDDPFSFLKEQIFKPCTIFPFITNDGKLGLKIHQQPTTSEGVQTFDESKIIGFVEKYNTMEEYVNHIILDYQRKITKEVDTFSKTLYAVEPTALKKTRFLSPREQPLKFELEGINFPGDLAKQEAVIQNIIGTFFTRYASSITRIVFNTTMSFADGVSVGDYIGLDHRSLIEWNGENAGKRGLEGAEVDPGDPTAHLDVGDEWAGFVNNNTLGTSILAGNHVFLDTTTSELKAGFFLGVNESCQSNHSDFDNFLSQQ